MKSSLSLLLVLFLLLSHNLAAQAPGCPDVDAGPDQTLDCVTSCTNITATIFQSGETSDYTVSSIPFAPPFPFTGGNQVFINIDDRWTNVINLPFNFCFYGNMYNRVIVGTNGLISFDLSHANNTCQWQFSSSIPTPGPPTSGIGIYNNSINGAYHDIDPAVPVPIPTFPFFGNPSNINYAVLGTAPCRTFVVNFGTVPHYNCNSLRTNQQIVLYETTNAIEVYIKDKPTCNAWNNGNAVIGLQNIDGTKGITPPGRNTGPWSATNEAWRFTPSGVPNWTLTWFDAQMNPLGNTATINVCPVGTTTYTVQGFYRACDGSNVTVQDQVTVGFANGFTPSFTQMDETCAGCDGSITASATGGTPPFTFNIGNGAQQSGNFGGLCDGNYSITVNDAASCTGVLNVTITPSATITVTASATDETCAGQSDGSITLSASGGTAPYAYDIGYGQPNSSGLFTALPPNTYSYTVTDGGGCSFTGSLTVGTQACCVMTNTVASTPPLCNGSCDGTITLTQNLGTAPVQFSINNGTSFQSTGSFSGLCAGNYAILIRDAAGCEFTDVVTLTDPAAITVTATTVTASCGCDGSLTATATGNNGPFEYSVDGGPFQSNPVFNVCPGNRTITARDVLGCLGTTTVTVATSGGLSITDIIVVAPSCAAACDGSITINVTGVPTDYSIDGGASIQQSNYFGNLCAGTYNIAISDGGICIVRDVVTITDPAALTVTAVATDALCNGDCTGAVDNTATGGTPPYQYSMDNGVSFQTSGLFTALCPGAYTLQVVDDNGCGATTGITVNEPSAINVSTSTTDLTCPDVCNGAIDIVASGGVAPYSYSTAGIPETDIPRITGLCAGGFELTVTDNNNCITTSPFTLDEPEGVTVYAGEDDTVRIGESITLNGTVSEESLEDALVWSPSTGLSCTNCVSPVAGPLNTTLYTLSVDAGGCTYTDDVQVIVFSEPLVNIPNAFTPNGDGLNDIFFITGWEVDDVRIYVFDRWGENVFETGNINDGWDGRVRGKEPQPGVYVYLVQVTYLTGIKETFKGSLTLLR